MRLYNGEVTAANIPTDEAVVLTAVLYPLPSKTDAALDGIRDAIAAIHAEQGCLLYAAHRAPDDTIVLVEKWATRADLEAHGSGTAVAALLARLAGLIASPSHLTELVPVPLGEASKGEL